MGYSGTMNMLSEHVVAGSGAICHEKMRTEAFSAKRDDDDDGAWRPFLCLDMDLADE